MWALGREQRHKEAGNCNHENETNSTYIRCPRKEHGQKENAVHGLSALESKAPALRLCMGLKERSEVKQPWVQMPALLFITWVSGTRVLGLFVLQTLLRGETIITNLLCWYRN